jgi:hypothetical protein
MQGWMASSVEPLLAVLMALQQAAKSPLQASRLDSMGFSP